METTRFLRDYVSFKTPSLINNTFNFHLNVEAITSADIPLKITVINVMFSQKASLSIDYG